MPMRTSFSASPSPAIAHQRRRWHHRAAWALLLALSACGGGSDGDATPEGRAQALAAGAAATSWIEVPQVADPLIDGVVPGAQADTLGMFSPVLPWAINAIHLTQLPNGKVMGWGPRGDALAAMTYDVWDPAKGTTLAAAHTVWDDFGKPDSFCGGATYLPSGVLLQGEGGSDGVAKSTFIFDPATQARVQLATSFAHQRWYATMLTLADGRALTLGGMVPYTEGQYANPVGALNAGQSSLTPEIFELAQAGDPKSGAWRSLLGASSELAFGPQFLRSSYPRAWVAPNGKVFGISTEQMWSLDPDGNNGQGVVTPLGAFKTGRDDVTRPNIGTPGTAVMYAPGRILKVGGNGYWVLDGAVASAAATIVDINGPTPQLTEAAPMRFGRRMVNATVLPDGQVFVHGGTELAISEVNAVRTPEMWNPTTGLWTTMAPAVRARLYHNTAVLLENGTVLTAGGGTPGPVFNANAEVFYPPYLFRRVNNQVVWAPRPRMNGISSNAVSHGGELKISMADGVAVREVALMGIGMATHGFNAGQRRIPLTFTQDGSVVTSSVPGAQLVPPGYYQLVVVGTDGVPSRAVTISVGAGVVPPPVGTTPFVPKLLEPVAAPLLDPGATASYTARLNEPDAQLSWDFGDGSPATAYAPASTVTHTYANPGVYLVTLRMVGASGVVTTTTFVQTVRTPRTAQAPQSSSAMLVEPLSGGGHRVWVANPDQDTVAVIDGSSLTRVAEIAVGRGPRSLAMAPDGRIWVTLKDDAGIAILSPASLAKTGSVALPAGSRPHGLVFSPDGAAAWVALEGLGQVARLNPTSAAVLATADQPFTVRHLAVTADGQSLLVPNFITPPAPGESTAQVDTAQAAAQMRVLQAATLALSRTVLLRHQNTDDGEIDGGGLPNYLGAPAISPDGRSAWLPAKKDNIRRGLLRNGQPLNFQNTVRAMSTAVDLDTLTELPQRRVDHDNSSLASAALFHGSGAFLFVALETSREVAIINVHEAGQVQRLAVGRAPQGLALSPDGQRLYVQNFMDRSVSVVDLAPLLQQGRFETTVQATVPTVATERLAAVTLRGKQFFYDAKDPRLARDAYMSCAACHSEGGHDGRTWDLSHSGEGLRNTLSLVGRGGAFQGRVHWSGNFDEIQDFEAQIRQLAGGTGLVADSLLNVGTRSSALGDRKTGLSQDLDALAAYVSSLTTLPASPYRAADGSLTAEAVQGRETFRQQCVACHVGGQFSDRFRNGLRDVGTLKPTSGNRLGGPLKGLATPPLQGLWASAPYLHDGSAATLEDAVRAHQVRGMNVSADQLAPLVAYLRQLGPQEPTHGLVGSYYLRSVTVTPDQSFNMTPVFQRVEDINFDWGRTDLVPSTAVAPGPGVPHDYFSARWTGSLIAPVSGTYVLRTVSDEGIRMWFGTARSLLINNWGAHWPVNNDVTVTLVAGQAYPITIEYYNNVLAATAKLMWKTPQDTSFVTVPIEQLWTDPAGPGTLPARLQDLTPAAPLGGTGLTASYFTLDNNANYTQLPVLVRRDASVNFDWGYGSPTPAVTADSFSVRWRGFVQPRFTGDHRFQTTSDSRIRLKVDGRLLIENWLPHVAQVDTSAPVHLVAGQRYEIEIDYAETGGTAQAVLRWQEPGQATYAVVPTDNLLPDTNGPSVAWGRGLKGEYFGNNNLSGAPLATRTEVPDFYFTGAPVVGVPADNFSVRWSGRVRPMVSGSYRFRTLSDDGVRLSVNGVQVINNWTIHGATYNQSELITLVAGQSYDIEMSYYDYLGVGYARLEWLPPGSTTQWQLLPEMLLYDGQVVPFQPDGRP